MMKPGCYECIHRSNTIGSHHSCCVHPSTGADPSDPFFGLLSMLSARDRSGPIPTPLNVVGNQHGISHGWFFWPFNFDPIWLESCDGFDPVKENREYQKDGVAEGD